MLLNIRKVDSLGRIVLPKEMRDELNLIDGRPGVADGSKLLLRCESGAITIVKALDGCKICGEEDSEIFEIDGIKICKKCAEKIYSKIKEKSL